MEPGGILIFDVNTPDKLRGLDGQVFLDEREDVYCVWRTEYVEEEQDLLLLDGHLHPPSRRRMEPERRGAPAEGVYRGRAADVADGCGIHPRPGLWGLPDGGPQGKEQRIYFSAIRGK